ncbi:MAG: phage tail protein [Bacteroidetes bacterium]|nr:MAG: phage tail protein [Bacteroidota bacterium]
MADGSAQTKKADRMDQWPIPKFYFRATFQYTTGGGKATVPFMEISGMDTEAQVTEYRAGGDKRFTLSKMPGLIKTNNVTFKKGMFKNDDEFWIEYSKNKMNTAKRMTVTIELLDEAGEATHTWTLTNAWFAKIIATDLNATANEIAIETLEVVHEGLKQNELSSPGEQKK